MSVTFIHHIFIYIIPITTH